jgi:glycine dehydrogenase
VALLNANYLMNRLKDYYKVKFVDGKGHCAHEFLIDFAEFEETAGLRVMDFAKRLIVSSFFVSTLFGNVADICLDQDYGFHPPTVSWPISTGMLVSVIALEHGRIRFDEILIRSSRPNRRVRRRSIDLQTP